ncbi:MAG: glycosyltransferase family 39 protein [Elusimicrobia bacterium]|nr:glycosyltransferase family 39 protein [Elusimicrobiota bacterium]
MSILLLGLLAFGGINKALSYDESIYLGIARTITRTGLPYRIGNSAGDELGESPFNSRILSTNPPLVLYAVSAPLRWRPTETFGPRLLYLFLFVVPVYLLVPWLAAHEFSLAAALNAALLMLFSRHYYDSVPRVLLNIPLGLFSLLTLWFYSRSLENVPRRRRMLLTSCLMMAAATTTKYQAIVILGAAGLEALLGSKDPAQRRRALVSFAALGASGALAFAALLALFHAGDPDVFAKLGENLSRLVGARSASASSGGLSAGLVAGRALWTLGTPLPALALAPFLLGRPLPRFARLLGAFCLLTLAFNLLARRWAGAGTSYLLPIFPPLAILAGYGIHLLLAARPSRVRVGLLVVLGIIQLAIGCPRTGLWPDLHPTQPELIGRHIARHRRPESRILAFDCSAQFFSDVPTGLLQYWAPKRVLAALGGDSTHVDFVVLPEPAGLNQPAFDHRTTLKPIWPDVRRLIRERFKPVDLGPDFTLYERLRPSL